MARSVINQNPFKYKSYPATPPSSPELSPTTDAPATAEALQNDEERVASNLTSSSKEIIINYDKRSILDVMKMIYSSTEPASSDLYVHRFITNKEIYDDLQRQFPKLPEYYSFQQVANWISGERDHFGPLKTHNVNQVPKKGRWLWVVKEEAAAALSENDASFRAHCKAAKGGWVNVGYVRKSPTKDTNKNRVHLLQLMAKKLVNRCLSTKIFASPSCQSSEPLLQRDCLKLTAILDELNGCDGDAQDLLAYLSTCTKKVRLCIIDYAGLSNDPNDVEWFLKKYKNIKEIAIDHGSSIELLDRFELLHGKKKMISKFKSRVGPVRRSKV